MKLEDIEKNKIEKEGLTFSPRFKYDYIDEDEELIGLEILATSEEVYQQHLENKNRLIEPQEVSKMEVRLGQIEEAVGVLATQIARSTLLNGGMK